MKNLCLLIILLFCFSTFGQQQKIDSLKRILKKVKVKDTSVVSSYTRIAYYYQYINPELSLKYADSSLQLAKKLKEIRYIASSYQATGSAYSFLSKNDKAEENYKKALLLGEKSKDKLTQGISLYSIAYLKSIQGKNKEAIDLALKSYSLFIEDGHKKKAGNVMNSIGANYFYLANYKKALEYYLKSLKIAEEIKDNDGIAQAYENIALIYKRQENMKRAYYYYEQSIIYFDKTNNLSRKLNTLNNYGAAKDQAGDIDGALKLYNEALLLAKSTKNIRMEYSILSNIAISEYGLKNYGVALDYFKKAYIFHKEQNDINNLSIILQYYAQTLIEAPDAILLKAGENPVEKYEKAEKYIDYCLKASLEVDDKDNELNLREILSEIYEKTGRYAQALAEHKLSISIKDSIYSAENKQEILEKQVQYESDKKQTLANAEINRQRVIKYAVMGTSGVVLLSGLFLFIGYKKRQKIKETQKELLLRAKISDIELKALRLQMNPHFIFNSLNSISDYIQKNDTQKADYYLAKFAKLMRGILENSEEREIPLADEMKMLELYIQLEKSRLKDKFSYEIKIDDDIDAENTNIPPLILQPFVENSIWHGVAAMEGEGKILIHISKDNSMLNCIVEDNGIGRSESKDSGKKSFGMKITKDRLEMLNKLKNTNASVNLVDLQKGTKVEVKLPFENDEI